MRTKGRSRFSPQHFRLSGDTNLLGSPALLPDFPSLLSYGVFSAPLGWRVFFSCEAPELLSATANARKELMARHVQKEMLLFPPGSNCFITTDAMRSLHRQSSARAPVVERCGLMNLGARARTL